MDRPLRIAAFAGHEDAVKLLLEESAKVNEADNQGRTPLHAAAHAGHAGIVKLLLEKGADRALKDKKGETAKPGRTRNPRYAASFAMLTGRREL